MAIAIFPAAAHAAGGTSQTPLSRMPDSPAKQLISNKCGACHDSGHVLDQTRTRSDWTDVVVLMRDYGAKVSPDEQKNIVDYLAKNFGRAPAPAKSTSPPLVINARASSSGSSPASSSGSSPSSSGTASSVVRVSQPAQASGKASAPAAPSSGASATAAGSTAASPGGLPPGPGRELVQTKCTMCHNLDRVIGSHRTRAEWQQLVTAMQEYGADVYDEDEKTVVNYLSKSFPPNSSSKGAAAKGAPAQ